MSEFQIVITVYYNLRLGIWQFSQVLPASILLHHGEIVIKLIFQNDYDWVPMNFLTNLHWGYVVLLFLYAFIDY